jgi:plastocyanin
MSHPFRRLALRALSLVSLMTGGGLLASCSGAYAIGPSTPNGISATASLQFTPATLTIYSGEEVTFFFGPVAHNVFFDAAAGTPSDIEGNNTQVAISRVFATPGTYHYTCHIHPGMEGTVEVLATGSTTYRRGGGRREPRP